jgi:hypothetical protein
MLKQVDTVIGFIVIMSVVSLLIMIATQVLSSLFALRGQNLADSLEALFRKVDPLIPANDVKKLIHNALTDPLISDSVLSTDRKGGGWWGRLRTRWMRASAIRPDELLAHLYKEAGSPGLTTAPMSLVAPQDGTAAAAWRILSALRADHSPLVRGPAQTASAELARFEKWFNSAQDRAGQWFAMHTRILTVGAALVAAFALQLDTISLIRKLSADPDLRARLVARADAVQRQTEIAVNQAFSVNLHRKVMELLRTRYPELGLSLDNLPPTATSLPRAQEWLAGKLAADPKADEITSAYGQEALVLEVGRSQDNFVESVRDFNDTGLALVPDPYPRLVTTVWPLRHLIGLLVSVALLSLGAPFWFNLLKQLVSLRPALADSIDQQPKQS